MSKRPHPQAPPLKLGLCSACAYWEQTTAGEPPPALGHCRVQSPQHVPSLGGWQTQRQPVGLVTAHWPVTQADDWCGQWVTK